MTDENRKLAEWMGWHTDRAFKMSNNAIREVRGWFDETGDMRFYEDELNFRESLEQAMMLLDKVLSWTLRKEKTGYNQADVNISGKVFESEWELTPAAAIVEAVLKVIEGEK